MIIFLFANLKGLLRKVRMIMMKMIIMMTMIIIMMMMMIISLSLSRKACPKDDRVDTISLLLHNSHL